MSAARGGLMEEVGNGGSLAVRVPYALSDMQERGLGAGRGGGDD